MNRNTRVCGTGSMGCSVLYLVCAALFIFYINRLYDSHFNSIPYSLGGLEYLAFTQKARVRLPVREW